MEQSNQAARRRFTAEERAKYIELYYQSGLTQRAFAEQQGLHVATLHQWLHRSKTTSEAGVPIFKEFPLAGSGHAWAAEIALGQEVFVRLGAPASAEFIAQLVNSLRR